MKFDDSRFLFFPEIDSTNSYLKENFTPAPLTVWTDFQRDGYGRFGRKWVAEPGSALLFSNVYHFPKTESFSDDVSSSTYLQMATLAAGSVILYGIKDAVSAWSGFTPNNLMIKWPNDILWNQKKQKKNI